MTSKAVAANPERIFEHRRQGEAFGDLDRGLIVGRMGPVPAQVSRAWSGSRVLSADEHEHVLHVPRSAGGFTLAGLAAVRYGGTTAVVLHRGGQAEAARLPLEFARHLSQRRQDDPQPVRPCVTSATKPELESAAGLVRVPHLVGVHGAAGALVDSVIWEVLTAAQALQWLGGPLPGQEFFERHIPALLRLRSLARAGQLPAGGDGDRIRELLSGHYMSIRMVYRHPALFSALVSSTTAGLDPGDENG
jgi:hypothetical protein